MILPETAPSLQKDALNLGKITKTYKQKFRKPKLVYPAIMMGCSTSIVYIYSSIAPFLGIKGIGLTPEEYGFFNLIPPSGLIAGSFISHLFASKKEKLAVIRSGMQIALIVISIMILFYSIFPINKWMLFLPMPFLYLGSSLVFNNSSSFAMDQVSDKSSGSAVMSFLNVGTATLAVLAIQPVSSPFPLFMPLAFSLFIFIQIILYRRLSRK